VKARRRFWGHRRQLRDKGLDVAMRGWLKAGGEAEVTMPESEGIIIFTE
jgi:hypothetical protein